MRRNQIAGIVLMGAAAAGFVGCGGPTKYEGEKFAGTGAVEKEAGNYWKHDGWWGGLPKDVRKVAVTEFVVEYVTKNVNKSGADTLSILGAAELMGMGKRKREFTEEFKWAFPQKLYDGFATAMAAEGMEVVPLEKLATDPALAGWQQTGKVRDSSQNARNFLGGQNRNESAGIQSYPLPGLPIASGNIFKATENAKSEAMAVVNTGAQGALHVHIRVALDDDGHAVLDAGSMVRCFYQLEKAGSDYYMKGTGAIVGKGAMRDDVPVITAKEFKAFQGDVYTVDGPKFEESIMRMYPTYARMAVVKLKG